MSRVKKPVDEVVEDKVAVATGAQSAQVEATSTAEAPGDDAAQPAGDGIQPGPDGVREADSGAPPVVELGSAPIAALTDPASIASQIVQGDPDPDLVEAVRKVLAGEYVPAASFNPFGSPLPPARTAKTLLGHMALMDLDHDGKSYAPFELVFVTEPEFDRLKAAHVFTGWWDEGVEEA